MDYEFYDEPTEFDLQIDEFKQSLMTSVKTEFLEKMEHIQKENDELQQIKNDFKSIKNDYAQKQRELEIKMQDAKREATKLRLSELMKDREFTLYKIGRDYKKVEKCNLCNENRYIELSTPGGKKHSVPCDCNSGISFYVPAVYIAYAFGFKTHDRQLNVWYKLALDYDKEDYLKFDRDYSSYSPAKYYSPDQKFDDLKQDEIWFKSIEDCQKYCDWLNEKEANKGKVPL